MKFIHKCDIFMILFVT